MGVWEHGPGRLVPPVMGASEARKAPGPTGKMVGAMAGTGRAVPLHNLRSLREDRACHETDLERGLNPPVS